MLLSGDALPAEWATVRGFISVHGECSGYCDTAHKVWEEQLTRTAGPFDSQRTMAACVYGCDSDRPELGGRAFDRARPALGPRAAASVASDPVAGDGGDAFRRPQPVRHRPMGPLPAAGGAEDARLHARPHARGLDLAPGLQAGRCRRRGSGAGRLGGCGPRRGGSERGGGRQGVTRHVSGGDPRTGGGGGVRDRGRPRAGANGGSGPAPIRGN